MNPFWASVLGGIFRALLASVGGYAVAQGAISAEAVTQIGGAAATIGAAALSVWAKYKASRG